MPMQSLTPQAAAKYLGFGASTLERWRRLGIGPKYLKLSSNRVAYLQSHLDDWLDSRVRTPAQERQP